MTDLVTPTRPGADVAVPAPAASVRRPAGTLLAGTLLLVGLALLAAAVVALRGHGWLQAGVALAGLILAHSGASRWGRRRFGPGFDLTLWLCGAWLVLLVVAAVAAPMLGLPEHEDLTGALGEPILARPDLVTNHPLGTNNFGLDLLARVLYGARASLVTALTAVLIGMVVGGALGILAGYFRGVVDVVIGILTNALLAVPPLILLIALATVLEPTLRNISLGLATLATPSMIRMARATTIAVSQREFVTAARSMGASGPHVMLRELLPNVVLPLASYGMVMVSVLIVAEASLSFLGLGIQAPAPSWGNMIAEGEGTVFRDHPHIVLVPGTVLFLTVFSFNCLGERARRRFDPRRSQLEEA
ncbi:ABC transporter permease [Nocardioides sp. BGMRC 2183]|nr:ABC transporter permease [Nocardioides sp. BGMRC 2183]